MKSKRESSFSLSIHIYTYIHFSIHVSQTNPGFRVAFGAVVAATEISGIDLGMISPPFFPQGRARERTNKRTNPQHGVEEDCGQFLSPVGREWNESVTSTRSYRPLLGRAPAAVTLATHVHFLLHRKGRVSPRRGAVCATRLRHFLSTGFSSLTIQPSPDIRSTTLLLFFHPQNSLWKIS